MNNERVVRMTDKIAENGVGEVAPHSTESDQALVNIDGALDAFVAAIAVLEDNLPRVKPESVPEQASLDAITDLLDNAIKPYLSDLLIAIRIFE